MSFCKTWYVCALLFAGGASQQELCAQDLLWHNTATGQLATWAISPTGGVVKGSQVLSRLCVPSNGCTSSWKAVGTGDFANENTLGIFAAKNCAISSECIRHRDVLWDDPVTGELQEWLVDLDGTVRGTQSLSLRCDAASGCSAAWKAVATGDFNGDGNTDVLWHNATTGQLGYWTLDGTGQVTSLPLLTVLCDSACAAVWRVAGASDFNHDGHADVLWQNTQTQELLVWLLDGAARVIGFRSLLPGCPGPAGCVSGSVIAGTADFNNDQLPDVLRFDPNGGQVVAWLLDSTGAVTGTQSLTWTCAASSTCSTFWHPVGVIRTKRVGPINP